MVKDSDRYTVYNLSGILLMKNVSAAQLRKLPQGIYIINGETVLLHE
ncbi:MAG: hypothetical protein ACI308_09355 [Muribaculaceae bacterium]